MIEYLFELDSVCNTVREVEIGQQALFDAVALRGSEVVLSYNQLSDSAVFWAAIEDKATREAMLELCRCGRIRVNLYKGTRTAAQYIVTKLDPIIDRPNSNGVDGFVFSYLGLSRNDVEILKVLRDAICYCDPMLLDPESHQEGSLQRVKLSEYSSKYDDRLVVFAKTILVLSENENSLVLQREVKGNRLCNVLTEFARLYSYGCGSKHTPPLSSPSKATLFCSAADLISDLMASSKEEGWNSDNRSDWYNRLKNYVADKSYEGEKTQTAKASEAIVDIVYNFVNEDSIDGVERRYRWDGEKQFWELDAFWGVFWQSLGNYWETIDKGIHNPHCVDSSSRLSDEGHPDLPDWTFALEFITRNASYLKNHPKSRFAAGGGLQRDFSEEDFDTRVKRQKRWWKDVHGKRVIEQFVILVVKIVLLVLALTCTDIFQEVLDSSSLLNHFIIILIVELASELLDYIFESLSKWSGHLASWVGTIGICEFFSNIRDLATEWKRLENYGKKP